MLGEIFGAVTSILGGDRNRRDAEKYNWDQVKLSKQNMAMQKEFAKHGIRWKVEDAKAAGLHPLAALGANTMSFSPVRVGYSPPGDGGVSRMGQDISRAMRSMKTSEEKRLMDAQIGLIKAQTMALNRTGTGPGMPTPGADPITGVVDKPGTQGVNWQDSKLDKKDQPGITAGQGALYSFSERPDGSLVMHISEKAAEALESDAPAWVQNIIYRGGYEAYWRYLMKNKDVSIIDSLRKFRPKRAPKGVTYRYDVYKSAWYPYKKVGKGDQPMLVPSQMAALFENQVRKYKIQQGRQRRRESVKHWGTPRR